MQEIIAIALAAVALLWLLRRALARPGGACGHCSGCGDPSAERGSCPSAASSPKASPPHS